MFKTSTKAKILGSTKWRRRQNIQLEPGNQKTIEQDKFTTNLFRGGKNDHLS